MNTLSIIIMCTPISIILLDIFIYLAVAWWKFTGKNPMREHRSPIRAMIDKVNLIKHKHYDNGDEDYIGGVILGLGLFGTAIAALLAILIEVAPIVFPIIIAIIIFTAVLRVLRTFGGAIKGLAKYAHKHKKGDYENVDIDTSALTDTEQEVLSNLLRKVKK